MDSLFALFRVKSIVRFLIYVFNVELSQLKGRINGISHLKNHSNLVYLFQYSLSAQQRIRLQATNTRSRVQRRNENFYTPRTFAHRTYLCTTVTCRKTFGTKVNVVVKMPKNNGRWLKSR